MNRTELISKAVNLQKEFNRLIMRYKPEKWMALDITISQLKSVIYIHSKGKVSFKELAKALNVSPPVVTGIVDRLTSQNIISHTDGTDDRRVKWLVITEKGKRLLNDIRQDTTSEMSKMLEILSDEDIAALVQGFTALAKTAENYFVSNDRIAVATNS
jgi:DNA-binding MarR family transcriptional regulator